MRFQIQLQFLATITSNDIEFYFFKYMYCNIYKENKDFCIIDEKLAIFIFGLHYRSHYYNTYITHLDHRATFLLYLLPQKITVS